MTNSIATKQWHDLKVMTYNICYLPKAVTQFTDRQRFSIARRIKAIARIIACEKPDLIGIQEARDEITRKRKISVIALLIEHLSPMGYQLIVEPGNPTANAFYNVIIYSTRLALMTINRFWPTDREIEKCDDVWGNGYPRVIVEATFKMVSFQPKNGIFLCTPKVLESFKEKAALKEEVIDLGNGSYEQLGLLWSAGLSLGYRFIHLPASCFGSVCIIAYDAARRFPHAPKINLKKSSVSFEFYPIEEKIISRISQCNGDRVDLCISTPNYGAVSPIKLVVKGISSITPQQIRSVVPIVMLNVHHGLGKKYSHPFEKRFTNQMLAKRVNRYTSDHHIFLVGDFNSLPEDAQKELAPFNKQGANMRHLGTHPLKTEKGIAVSGTFICYPYDPFYKKMPKNKFGVTLDHIFYKAVNKARVYRIKTYVVAKTGDPNLDDRMIKQESELINNEGQELRHLYPSDHLPLVSSTRVEV